MELDKSVAAVVTGGASGLGEATARVWGLYMAGSRMGFDTNEIQLHQVLATKTDADGFSGYPLRHDFGV